MSAEVLEARPQDLRRLLSLESWANEKASALRAWGIRADDLPRLLRRHERKFSAAGVLLRHGKAWRLIEPYGARRDEPALGGLLRELVVHLQTERDLAAEKARGKSSKTGKSAA